MREIKFRGFGSGAWRYGYYVHLSHKPHSESYYNPNFRDFIVSDSEYGIHHIPVDPETVGQFTGFYDKTGKKIFEGDIVKIDEIFPILLEVYYNAEKGSFCLAEYTHTQGVIKGSAPLGTVWESYPSMEVIGNVHDNPELMKGVEK